ncbi:unnamed protein product [Triticum turgidum subsp. durum]|uniref:Phospholipase C n=1 Tax=Triticum turgidum subsp. durum TaxID=4567 RepID=A0A9R0SMX9_TRITD|nr:unnamed protein product [Triticum turgidum subsp. durum]
MATDLDGVAQCRFRVRCGRMDSRRRTTLSGVVVASMAERPDTVRSLDSSRSMCALSGHSDEVNCLDFFMRGDRQYLVTGSEDMTAKIWDIQKKTCVETLKGFMFPVVSVVCHPSLPLVITGLIQLNLREISKFCIEGVKKKTIFDSLEEDGLSFGIYYQNIPATLFYQSLRRLKHLLKFHQYSLRFKLDAARGKLPNYVVIEQRYFDCKEFPANDDHPSHDVARGQRFVKEVYETLRASPQWNETALIITYDEHGGFYDHVPTPVKVPQPDGIIGPDPYYFKFDRLGVRVPSFLISPWVEKGTVIHEPNGPEETSQYEHSSIPATVKKLFNLRANYLTKRDSWAGTFESYLKVRKTPRTDCPEKLPEVTKSLRPFGANEDKSLSEFQVELIQLASQLKGDHVLNSYPDIGKTMSVGEANRYAEDAVSRFLEAGRIALRADFKNISPLASLRPKRHFSAALRPKFGLRSRLGQGVSVLGRWALFGLALTEELSSGYCKRMCYMPEQVLLQEDVLEPKPTSICY